MTGSRQRDALQQIAGVALIAGALLTGVSNVLHPTTSDPNNMQEWIQKIAQASPGYWQGIHIGLAVGLWLLAAGTAGIQRSITSGAGEAWARLGFYGLMMGTTLWTVIFGIDGLGVPMVVNEWQKAAAADKAAMFTAVTTLMTALNGLTFLAVIGYWLSLA